MKADTIAYLITPSERTVQRVRVSDYKDIYHWIGADCFDVARFAENGDGVFVDDNGLLVQRPADDFFSIDDYPEPLAGRGLVMGVDNEGESIAPKTTWERFCVLVQCVTIMRVNGNLVFAGVRPKILDDILPAPRR